VRRVGDQEWLVTYDPAAEPAPESRHVMLTRFSTGADFVLER
jgi:hypothetical protein